MPTPVSETLTDSRPDRRSCERERITDPPSGVYLQAFEMMLVRMVSILTSSSSSVIAGASETNWNSSFGKFSSNTCRIWRENPTSSRAERVTLSVDSTLSL